jgi:hypothetical protein
VRGCKKKERKKKKKKNKKKKNKEVEMGWTCCSEGKRNTKRIYGSEMS